jgi:hypothetical protein
MKRWRVETEEGKAFFVYTEHPVQAKVMVGGNGLGIPARCYEVGSFEDGVLTIPEEESRACASSIQYGPVKPAKGRRG